jgi:hypothetical protein
LVVFTCGRYEFGEGLGERRSISRCHPAQDAGEDVPAVIIDAFQQTLTGRRKGQLDVASVFGEIASIKQSGLDQSIADAACGGKVYVEGGGDGSGIQVPRL